MATAHAPACRRNGFYSRNACLHSEEVKTHDGKLIGDCDHIIALEGDHKIVEGTPEEMIKISEFVRELSGKGGEEDVR